MPVVEGSRPVPEENLHVTLHFIGSVALERTQEVLALARDLTSRQTSATVVEVTGYPTKARARALVVRLSVDPVLEGWRRELVSRWPTDEKVHDFEPHVTLARSRRPIAVESAVPVVGSLVGMDISLCAPAVYVSDTRPEGARYTRLGEADLQVP